MCYPSQFQHFVKVYASFASPSKISQTTCGSLRASDSRIHTDFIRLNVSKSNVLNHINQGFGCPSLHHHVKGLCPFQFPFENLVFETLKMKMVEKMNDPTHLVEFGVSSQQDSIRDGGAVGIVVCANSMSKLNAARVIICYNWAPTSLLQYTKYHSLTPM